MGLTPAGGLVMGSRSGDVDPGVVIYLARFRHLVAPVARSRVCHELSFLGVELLGKPNVIDGPLISRRETESTFA